MTDSVLGVGDKVLALVFQDSVGGGEKQQTNEENSG